MFHSYENLLGPNMKVGQHHFSDVSWHVLERSFHPTGMWEHRKCKIQYDGRKTRVSMDSSGSGDFAF